MERVSVSPIYCPGVSSLLNSSKIYQEQSDQDQHRARRIRGNRHPFALASVDIIGVESELGLFGRVEVNRSHASISVLFGV